MKWKKDKFHGLLIYQRVSTSIFFLNTKIFYQNYFCMRNKTDEILIQLEVLIKVCRFRYLKKSVIILADMFKLLYVARWNRFAK